MYSLFTFSCNASDSFLILSSFHKKILEKNLKPNIVALVAVMDIIAQGLLNRDEARVHERYNNFYSSSTQHLGPWQSISEGDGQLIPPACGFLGCSLSSKETHTYTDGIHLIWKIHVKFFETHTNTFNRSKENLYIYKWYSCTNVPRISRRKRPIQHQI